MGEAEALQVTVTLVARSLVREVRPVRVWGGQFEEEDLEKTRRMTRMIRRVTRIPVTRIPVTRILMTRILVARIPAAKPTSAARQP